MSHLSASLPLLPYLSASPLRLYRASSHQMMSFANIVLVSAMCAAKYADREVWCLSSVHLCSANVPRAKERNGSDVGDVWVVAKVA